MIMMMMMMMKSGRLRKFKASYVVDKRFCEMWIECVIDQNASSSVVRLSVLRDWFAFTGLIKPKKYDWKDSNLALFGTDTEKQVKSETSLLMIFVDIYTVAYNCNWSTATRSEMS